MTMKWESDGFKGEIAKARGLGSARDGVRHWIHQRITALAGVLLLLWMTREMIGLIQTGGSYDATIAWMRSGLTPVFLILTVVTIFYHAKLGLQVVLEDYFHQEGLRLALLLLIKFALITGSVLCLYSILKVTL